MAIQATQPSSLHEKSSWIGLFVLLTGGFVTIFDMFAVNVAIPSIQSDLGADFSEIGFVIAGYELAFGVALITGGRLGDMYGRRRLYAIGMIGFAVTSALCGLAPTSLMLIIARLLQGIAAALLFPQVYALVRVNFDEHDRRRAFGLLGMTLGLAAIAGQILGGLMVEADIFGLGWRLIFLVNVPIGIVTVLLCRSIPESQAPDAPHLDWTGCILAGSGLLLLLAPLLKGPTAGWPMWTYGSLVAAAILLATFVRFEQRLAGKGGFPVVDMALFKDRDFAIGSFVVLAIYSTATSFFLCIALLLQTGLGLSPFVAGSIFAPASVAFVIASLVAPKLIARFGNSAIAAGALLYAAGIGILIGQVGINGGSIDPLSLIPALFVFGFGQALCMTPLLNLVLGFVPARQAGVAAGIISTMQQVGGAIGVSIVGIFFVHLLANADADGNGYATAFSGAMLYNLATALVAAVLIFWIAYRQAGLASAKGLSD